MMKEILENNIHTDVTNSFYIAHKLAYSSNCDDIVSFFSIMLVKTHQLLVLIYGPYRNFLS